MEIVTYRWPTPPVPEIQAHSRHTAVHTTAGTGLYRQTTAPGATLRTTLCPVAHLRMRAKFTPLPEHRVSPDQAFSPLADLSAKALTGVSLVHGCPSTSVFVCRHNHPHAGGYSLPGHNIKPLVRPSPQKRHCLRRSNWNRAPARPGGSMPDSHPPIHLTHSTHTLQSPRQPSKPWPVTLGTP